MKDRGQIVYGRLRFRNVSFPPDGVVGDRLPTERNKTGNVVGIHPVCRQPLFVEADHGGKIPPRGMSADKDLFGGAPIFGNVSKCPGNRRRGVLNIGGGFRFGTEPIVNRHHRDPFSFEFQRNRTISIFQCATVKPHNGGKLF